MLKDWSKEVIIIIKWFSLVCVCFFVAPAFSNDQQYSYSVHLILSLWSDWFLRETTVLFLFLGYHLSSATLYVPQFTYAATMANTKNDVDSNLIMPEPLLFILTTDTHWNRGPGMIWRDLSQGRRIVNIKPARLPLMSKMSKQSGIMVPISITYVQFAKMKLMLVLYIDIIEVSKLIWECKIKSKWECECENSWIMKCEWSKYTEYEIN